MFRVIGIYKHFEGYYLNSKNITKFDHWLYGKCNNDSNTKGISYLIDKEYFNESACIRKLYNHIDGLYYDVNELILYDQIYLMVIIILMLLFIVLLWKNVRKILYN